MELNKTYNPKEVEDKWYQYWLDHKFFASKPNPDKEPFTVVIPPPNVTGVLHMGHMLNNTIQDVLVRRQRMKGKEACWVPGTDHASIATEAKVVAMLKEKGMEKKDLSREEFLEYAWEWKEKYGGIILEQLKKLGASCDWDRTRFTMEESLSQSVIKVFVDLYQKGYIYRGIRMVNWDPQGKTALSDEEVIYKEVNSKLFYVKYKVEGTEDEWVTIATTRPETILADTAVCVHPEDERFKKLIGKKVIIPMVNRAVPVIADEYVDPEYGTGCLKITPAHDLNDYEIGLRHNLEVIDIIDDNGKLNEKAQHFVGIDRFAVRKAIVKDLEEMGQLVKVEEMVNKVGYSERTSAVIEPKLSLQWFVKMEDLAKPALENVMNDTIQFHPPKFKNMYRHWMENVKDWCISRQLWWGQRIPAFYLPNGEYVVAETPEEALKLAQEKIPGISLEQLKQDEDVLDTWFSSWLWPISVFDGLTDPDNEDINYYYPTSDLVTAPEILFFWVARMIIAGYEYKGNFPFKNVYLTGIVRDKKGQKMSKSLGNSPDPLDLIKEYGADGVRTGMLFSSPAGNDLLFDIKLCTQGRNFANKIWNAFRLVQGWEVDASLDTSVNKVAVDWFEAKFNQAFEEIEAHYEKYRISDALMSLYKLVWEDFCSWYLEMVKPKFEQPVDSYTYQSTIQFFEKLMKVLHPFMPFISEEIYQHIQKREEKDALIIADYPVANAVDQQLLNEAEVIFFVISNIRNTRNAKQISPKTALELHIKTENQALYETFAPVIQKLANISGIHYTDTQLEKAISFVHKGDEYFIPVEGELDVEKEKEKIEKEIAYTEGFLKGVNKKLGNERFVNNAPEQVVANEKQKQADAEAKLQALREQLASL
ncbi:valine--tRNA ligase [Rapidithrix thailandica]|uniref:Valine--tRNA ligase n=1 Tax=Rapidithrix thailandica TaxID=413964 RepID=A0AAW9S1S5_9BACT